MPQSEHGGARRHPGLPARPGFSADLSRRRVDAHRPRLASSARALALGVATTVVVFALAVALVTVLEVVVDHPLSGGAPGGTTLGEMIHPATAPHTR